MGGLPALLVRDPDLGRFCAGDGPDRELGVRPRGRRDLDPLRARATSPLSAGVRRPRRARRVSCLAPRPPAWALLSARARRSELGLALGEVPAHRDDRALAALGVDRGVIVGELAELERHGLARVLRSVTADLDVRDLHVLERDLDHLGAALGSSGSLQHEYGGLDGAAVEQRTDELRTRGVDVLDDGEVFDACFRGAGAAAGMRGAFAQDPPAERHDVELLLVAGCGAFAGDAVDLE